MNTSTSRQMHTPKAVRIHVAGFITPLLCGLSRNRSPTLVKSLSTTAPQPWHGSCFSFERRYPPGCDGSVLPPGRPGNRDSRG